MCLSLREEKTSGLKQMSANHVQSLKTGLPTIGLKEAVCELVQGKSEVAHLSAFFTCQ